MRPHRSSVQGSWIWSQRLRYQLDLDGVRMRWQQAREKQAFHLNAMNEQLRSLSHRREPIPFESGLPGRLTVVQEAGKRKKEGPPPTHPGQISNSPEISLRP